MAQSWSQGQEKTGPSLPVRVYYLPAILGWGVSVVSLRKEIEQGTEPSVSGNISCKISRRVDASGCMDLPPKIVHSLSISRYSVTVQHSVVFAEAP